MLSLMLFELGGRNDRADGAVDLIDQEFGVLDTSTGGRAHVQPHHARIDDRKEILADDRQQAERKQDQYRDADQRQAAPPDESRERDPIALLQALERAIEPAHDLGP